MFIETIAVRGISKFNIKITSVVDGLLEPASHLVIGIFSLDDSDWSISVIE